MARLMVTAAGSAVDNTNIIDARFWSEAARNMRGWDVGVLDSSFLASDGNRNANTNFMWKIVAPNVSQIGIGRGMASAYGYDIKSDGDVTLQGSVPASGVKYLFVYLQWNFANPSLVYGDILLRDNGASTVWTLQQDNLVITPNGKFQMPLYRLAINTSGDIIGVISWESLGVETRRGVYWSKNTSHLEKNGTIDSTVKAITKADGTADDTVATTKFVADKFSFKLGAITGSAIASSWIKRQGNVVIGYFKLYETDAPLAYDTTLGRIREFDSTGMYTMRPKSPVEIGGNITIKNTREVVLGRISAKIQILTNGDIKVKAADSNQILGLSNYESSFCYEIT